MKRSHFLLTTAIAALIATGAAHAQRGPGPKGPGPMMGAVGGFNLLQFDANADGRVTRAELDSALRARFNELDTNRDGVVTAEEMRAAQQARRLTAQAERFARMDTDSDGKLSLEELQAAGPGANPGDARSGRGPGWRAGPGPRRGAAAAGDDVRITFADFSARQIEAFNRADANGDDVVTIAEIQATRRPRR